MTEPAPIESTDVTERVVLFELAEREARGDTPAAALELLEGARRRADALDGVFGGKLTEADLIRACRSLAADGLVSEARPDETSPTGKGRPEFALDVEPDAVREIVSEDDRLAGLPVEDLA